MRSTLNLPPLGVESVRELTTKSSGSHSTHLKTILVILVFFLVITGITEAQISSEVKINNGEIGENYSGESYNQSWNWTYNGYANQTDTKGVTGVVYVVGGGGGGSSLYNNAAENASTVVTPAVTSQVGKTSVDTLAKLNAEITDAFDAMRMMMGITLVVAIGLGVLFIMLRLRTLITDDEETPHHSSTPPQTVVSNTPHATIYVTGGGGAGGSGGEHTPHYNPIQTPTPVKYEQPKPKKPIVDRDGVEDDDSSFIEVLD